MNLFQPERTVPLAWRMQPGELDEFCGQDHVLAKGKPLRVAIEKDILVSLILYGPPGSGKTALARLIAGKTKARFTELNAVTSGVGDIKSAVRDAKRGGRTILFIDEIHRFNRLQQDALLPDVENGTVTLIGASTQNPFFSIIPALSSRSMIVQFHPLGVDDLLTILRRALSDSETGLGIMTVKVGEDTLRFIASSSEGDARRALNALEMGVSVAESTGKRSYDITLAREVLQEKALCYDTDEHYDTISAFIKSMRGSDPDASLYWLAKMIEAGEDPLFLGRRIVICASEDVGNADPRALEIAVAALRAVQSIGMPEGRIPLAQAAIYIAMAPKSNASYRAIENALSSIRSGQTDTVPAHLKGTGYSGAAKLGAGAGYKYPHDYEDHYVRQRYMNAERQFYIPSDQGYEQVHMRRLSKRRSRS